ncbi:hypothetical protein B0I35DRAFT_515566 [Stachybotrys elegans]|uniref:Uncharacterized protein n=1 Tax=Stachybotrys elegans TaxID=80388 RepID=A0A8K0SI97_9HYPO|nr:hypothetical protein B0I35DRAFT_515566 [Stachybotrys elegans]
MPNTRPGYPEGYQFATGSLGSLIDSRVANGFVNWGFVIFRGVYGNDAEWDKFMSLYKASVADELYDFGKQEELGPDLEWTIIEDRDALEGATKEAVRARFLEWVAARSIERDGELGDKPWVAKSMPRFKYCLYVDEVCFKTIVARPGGDQTRGPQWRLAGGNVVIINGMHEDYDDDEYDSDDPDGDDEYSPIDGNTNYDVGWAYIDVIGYTELFSHLSSGGSDSEIWYGMVYRGCRPEKHPERVHGCGQPLSAVPSGVQ